MKKKILMISMFLMMILAVGMIKPGEVYAETITISGPTITVTGSAADGRIYKVGYSANGNSYAGIMMNGSYDVSVPSATFTINLASLGKGAGYYSVDVMPADWWETQTSYASKSGLYWNGVTQQTGYVTLDANKSVTYGTTSTTFNIKTNHGGTLSVSDDNATATVSRNGNTVTISNIGSLSVGTTVKVTVSCAATSSYTAASAVFSLTFTKATGYVTLDANKSVAYGTTSTTFAIKTNHGGTLSVSDDNATATVSRSGTTVTINNIGSLNVGTTVKVTVSCAATTNYKAASATFSLTFSKINVTVTLSAKSAAVNYNSEGSFTAKGNVAGKIKAASADTGCVSITQGASDVSVNANATTTIKYKGVKAKTTATNITVTFTPTNTTNYNTTTATFSVTKVNKINVTVTLSAASAAVNYNSEGSFTAKGNVAGKIKAASADTACVSITQGASDVSVNANATTTIKYKGVKAKTTATNITVTFTPTDTTNYNTTTATFSVTKVNKINVTVTLSATSAAVNYNSEGSFTAKGNVAGKIKAASADTACVSITQGASDVSVNANATTTIKYKGVKAKTTATNITVTFTPTDTTNYNTTTATFSVTKVNKINVTVTLSATSAAVNYNSEGSFTAKGNVAGKIKAASADTACVSITQGASDVSVNANATTTIKYKGVKAKTTATNITVTFTPTDTTNYNTTTATFSVTKVNKIAGYVTLDANKSVPYKTASTTFAVKANHGGTLTVSDDNNTAGSSISGTTVTVSNIGGLNVGTTVKVTVKCAATTNYNEASATFSLTFSKINGSGSVTMANWTYGGTASSPSPTSSTNGTGSVTYSYKVQSAADSTYSGTKPSNAGSYTVRAVFAATTNYNAVTATANFTINRAGIARPTFADKKYTGASQSISAGTGYSLSGTTSGTNVNTYTATATPDANHQWSSGSNVTSGTSVSWKIVQRPITITTKAQTVETVDKVSQATSNVTVGGDGIVSGQSLTSIKLTGSTSTGKISASNAVIKSGNTDVTSQYAITYSNTGNLTCTKTAYVVRHYQMNLDGTNYTLKDTDNLTGTSGVKVTPGRKTYTGFTAPGGTEVTIKLDGTTVVEYRYTRNKYYLDLNGWLDGASSGNITNYGTANVYVNNVKVGNSVADYYAQHYYGSTYKIENVGAASGKVYKGVHSGSLEGTIGAANVGIQMEYRTLYTISCEDWFVDSSNNRKVLIPGTNATKTYEHGDTARGSAWGTGNNGSYRYHADTSVTVTSNATVYRYYYVWVDVNIYNPAGTQDYKSAYFSLSNDGTNWDTNLTNESAKSNNLPWGTVLTIKDLTPYYTYYVYDRCTGCTKSGNQWTYTVTGPNSMSIYMKYNSYTVTFNFNEGTTKNGSAVNTSQAITETYNSKYTLPATNPFRPGYTFNGWYTATSGGTKITTDTTVTITAAQTLYAQWTVKTYTLTVNPNSGTWSGSTNNQSFTQNYGTTKAIANPTKTGYTFKGWVLTKTIDSANYVELMYQAPGKAGFGNATGAQKANTVYLYSQLGQLANFKYNDKYDFIIAADENGKMYKWSQTSNPLTTTAVTGYSNTSNGMGGLVYNNTSTLLAVSTASNNWWNAIGMYGTGTNPIANADNLWTNQPVHFYVKAANDLSNLSTYTVTGALNDSNNYIFRDENVTLMAIWQANTYQVAYNANTGTGSMSTDTVTYDQNYTTKANEFSKEGYTFIGWNETADGTGTDWTARIGTPWKWNYDKNITLYAQWGTNYSVNGEYYPTLAAAYAAISGAVGAKEGTIVVERDNTDDSEFVVAEGDKITLNVPEGKKITLTTTSSYAITNSGELTITGAGTIETGNTAISGMIRNTNIVNISGVTLIHNGCANNNSHNIVSVGGTVNINSGTIIGRSTTGTLVRGISLYSNATVNMYDGEITVNASSNSIGIEAWSDGDYGNASGAINIYGGTIKSTTESEYSRAIQIADNGSRTSSTTLTIEDGILEGYYRGIDTNGNANGKITIKGGTVTGFNAEGILVAENNLLEIGGPDDAEVSTSSPVIQGETYGISGDFEFYDGVILGKENAINGDIKAKVTNKPTGYKIRISESGDYEKAILEQHNDINEFTISEISDSYTYMGEAITPIITITDDETELVENTDYTVTYDDNVNVGEATITIQGIGFYEGTKVITFNIIKANAQASISGYMGTYDREAHSITVTEVTGGTLLYSTDDETFRTENYSYTNVGEYPVYVKVSGDSNHNSSASACYYVVINPKVMNSPDITVTLEEDELEYTGEARIPNETVKDGDVTLVRDTDYSLAYENNTNAGTAYLRVVGEGNYAGAKRIEYTVTKAPVGNPIITNYEGAYDGEEHTITATGEVGGTLEYSTDGEDYSSIIPTQKHVGEYTVYVRVNPDNNHSAVAPISGTIKITPKNMNTEEITITANPASYEYDGSAKEPEVVVMDNGEELEVNTHYTVTYDNNTEAGSASIIITGNGDYTGSKTGFFTISKSASENPDIIQNEYTYDGEAHAIQILGGNGGTVVYSEDGLSWAEDLITKTNAGNYTIYVKVSGDKNHEDSTVMTTSLIIHPRDINSTEINVSLAPISFVYNGNEKEPVVTMTDGEAMLIKNTDFTVAYEGNIEAGTAKAIISGTGNYTGEREETFTIERATSHIPSVTDYEGVYDKEAHGITVTKEEGKEIAYSEDGETWLQEEIKKINVGEYIIYVKVVGAGSYADSEAVDAKITITPKDIADSTITATLEEDTYVYDGTEKEVLPLVKDGTKVLEKDVDYTLSYENATNVGTATVVITGIGNYEGSREVTYEITKATSENPTITNKEYTFDGAGHGIAVSGGNGGTIVYSEDGTNWSSTPVLKVNVEDYTIYVKVSGDDNHLDSAPATGSVIIHPKDIADEEVSISLDPASMVYTGEERRPEVVGTYGSLTLVKDTDFEAYYEENTDVGTARVLIYGIGNYEGSVEKNFQITKASLAAPEVSNFEGTYDQLPHGLTVTPVEIGTIAYSEDQNTWTESPILKTNAGTHTIFVKVLGDDNHSDSSATEGTIKITPKSINDLSVVSTLDQDTFTFDGTEKEPTPIVRDGGILLYKDVDYEVSYANNKEAGSGEVIISGIGNYEGTRTLKFNILKLTAAAPNVSDTVCTYDGAGHTITVENSAGMNIVYSEDELTWSSSPIMKVDAGEYPIFAKVVGTSSYSDSEVVSAKVIIERKDIADADVSISLADASLEYTGSARETDVLATYGSLTLVKNTDFSVYYENHINVGTAKAVISGIGNYTGSVERTYQITKVAFAAPVVTDFEGTYDKLTHGVSVAEVSQGIIVYSEDRTTWSASNITKKDVGIYTVYVKVSGDDNHTDSSIAEGKITITPKAIHDSTITVELDENTYTYDGTAKTPVPTVRDGATYLVEHTDYEYEYDENMDVGTAKVIITGIGNYKETKEVTFEITKAASTAPTVEDYNGVYDGAEHGVRVSGGLGGTVVYSLDNVHFSTTEIKKVNVSETTVYVKISGDKNHLDSNVVEGKIKISKKSAENLSITLSPNSYEYDGTAKTPSVTVKDGDTVLTVNKDYTFEYQDNVNAGTAKVIVRGSGDYGESKTAEFTINKVKATIGSVAGYTGIFDWASHGITVTSSNGGILQYSEDGTNWSESEVTKKDAGTYSIYVRVSGDQNHLNSDTQNATIKIDPKDISTLEMYFDPPAFTYDGEEKTPNAVIMDGEHQLIKNTDFEISYSNNTNMGTARGTATGIHNFTGEISDTFMIGRALFEGNVVIRGKAIYGETLTADVSSISPEPDAFTYVWYRSNVDDIEEATRITGATSSTYRLKEMDIEKYIFVEVTAIKANYAKQSFYDRTDETENLSDRVMDDEIDISKLDIVLEETEYVYDGTAKEPEVTISQAGEVLVEGEHYELVYGNNVNAGTASITITGKNGYKGRKVMYFTILKAEGTGEASIEGWKYGQTGNEPTASSSTNGNDNITFQYKLATDPDSEYSLVKPTNAGNYILRVEFAETQNYKAVVVLVEFTIEKGDGSASVNIEDWTYGETPSEPSASTTTNRNSRVIFEYKGAEEEDSEYTTTKPVNAGTYMIRATFAESINYTAAVATAEFHILKGAGFVEVDEEVKNVRYGRTNADIEVRNTHGGAISARIIEGQVEGVTILPNGNIITVSGLERMGLDSSLTVRVFSAETENYLEGYKDVVIHVISAEMKGRVTITGEARVGSTLTAEVSNLYPISARLEYQWYSNETNAVTGGTKISGATERTYTIGNGLVGKYIYVEVSAIVSGYDDYIMTDITDDENNGNKTVLKAKSNISITPSTAELLIGDTFTFTYHNYGPQALTITSSDEGVFVITENDTANGKLTVRGVSFGTARVVITAAATDDYEEQTIYAIVEVDRSFYTDGTRYYKTLKDAFQNAANGSTITVVEDAVETEPAEVAEGKTLKLDLAGKAISYVGANDFITVNGSLEVMDSNEEFTGLIASSASGFVMMNHGELTIKDDVEIRGTKGISNDGVLTLGVNDEDVNRWPIIRASGSAVTNSGTFYWNDGELIGNKDVLLTGNDPEIVTGAMAISEITGNVENRYLIKDHIPPVIVNVITDNDWVVSASTIQIVASDNVKVSKYAVTAENNEPSAESSEWKNTNTFTVNENGTYYVWVKDIAGNVSREEVEISWICLGIWNVTGTGDRVRAILKVDGEMLVETTGRGTVRNYEGNPPYANDERITKLTILDGVTAIGDHAFSLLPNVDEITIPASVHQISSSSFAKTNGFTKLTVESEYLKKDGLTLLDRDEHILYAYSTKNTETTKTLPSSMMEIGEGAFYQNTNLTELRTNKEITTVGKDAFQGFEGDVYYYASSTGMSDYVSRNPEEANFIMIDDIRPVVNSVVVNGGDNITASRDVTLTIDATDNVSVTQISIGESAVLDDTAWVAYSTEITYTLSESYGTKLLYVWAKDAAGNVSFLPCTAKILYSDAAFSLNGDELVVHYVDETGKDYYAYKEEIEGGGVSAGASVTVRTSGVVDHTTKGTYTLGYDAIVNGEKIASLERTVDVIENTWNTQTYTDGEFTFVVHESGKYAMITGYTGTSTTLAIPESVSYEGNALRVIDLGSGLAGHANITNVILPDTLIHIGSGALSGFTSLENMNIPVSLMSIAENALQFSGKENGTFSMHFTNNFRELEEGALRNANISSIIFEEGIKRISANAMENVGVEEPMTLSLPASLVEIGEKAFKGAKINKITVAEDSNSFKMSSDGVSLLTNDGREFIIYPAERVGTSYTIPDGVEEIRSAAFAFARNVEMVTLPSGLITIGEEAFLGTKLQHITIPESVVMIQKAAFMDVLPLSYVVIGGTPSIQENVFEGDENLSMIVAEDQNELITFAENVIAEDTILYVPSKLLETYRAQYEDVTIRPILALVGDAQMGIRYGASYEEQGVLALDERMTSAGTSSKVPGLVVIIEGRVNEQVTDRNTITYIARIGGKEVDRITRYVDVADEEAPVIVSAVSKEDWNPGKEVFTVTATDNIAVSGYLIKDTAQRPSANDENWQESNMVNATSNGTWYVFAKDASDNISNAYMVNASWVCKEKWDISKEENGSVWAVLTESEDKLIIYGAGETRDFEDIPSLPWTSYSTTITSVEVQNGVTKLGERVLANLPNVAEVSIAASVMEIAENAFIHTNHYETMNLNGNTNFIYEDGTLYDAQKKILYSHSNSFESIYRLPETVTKVCDYAFENNSIISVLDISHLTVIGEGAFDGAIHMVNLVVSKELSAVGDHAFRDVQGPVTYYSSCSVMVEHAARFAGDTEFIEIDDILPIISKVSINNDAFSTGDSEVILTLTMWDNKEIKKIIVEEDLSKRVLPRDSRWEDYDGSGTHPYTFDLPRGLKTIYVWVMDSSNNVCEVPASDSIMYANYDFDLKGNDLTVQYVDQSGKDYYRYEESVQGGYELDYSGITVNVNEEVSHKVVGTYDVTYTLIYDGNVVGEFVRNVDVIADAYQDTVYTDGEFKFVVDASGKYAKIIQYIGSASTVTFPEVVISGENRYTVIEVESLDDNAAIPTNVTSIHLPRTLISIGKNAFRGLNSLTEVSIPNSVMTIEENAFLGCGLSQITLGDNVRSVKESAFMNNQISELKFGKLIKEVSEDAFANSGSVNALEIPYTIDAIGEGAFGGMSIQEMILDIPEGTSSKYMVSGDMLMDMTNKVMLQVATAAGNSHYFVDDTISKIGARAFQNAEGLKMVLIQGAPSIGREAFANVGTLDVVIAHEAGSIATLENTNAVSSDTIIYVPDEEGYEMAPVWSSLDAALIRPIMKLVGDSSMMVQAGSTFEDPGVYMLEELFTEEGVSSTWEELSLKVTSKVDTMTLGESDMVYSLVLGEKILNSISRKVTVIDTISPVVSRVETLSSPQEGEERFKVIATDNHRVVAYAITAENVAPDVSSSIWVTTSNNVYASSNGTWYVWAKDEAGNISEGFKVVARNIERVVWDIGVIPNTVFAYMEEGNELVITGDGAVKEMARGELPWSNVKGTISTVTIDEGVTKLAEYTLSDLENVEEISIPSSLEEIGLSTFAGTNRFDRIVMENGNDYFTFVGSTLYDTDKQVLYVHTNKDLSTSFEVPDTVKVIGEEAFSGSITLNEVTLPDGLLRICDGAFAKIHNMSQMTIPESVTTMGDNVFLELGKNIDENAKVYYYETCSAMRDYAENRPDEKVDFIMINTVGPKLDSLTVTNLEDGTYAANTKVVITAVFSEEFKTDKGTLPVLSITWGTGSGTVTANLQGEKNGKNIAYEYIIQESDLGKLTCTGFEGELYDLEDVASTFTTAEIDSQIFAKTTVLVKKEGEDNQYASSLADAAQSVTGSVEIILLGDTVEEEEVIFPSYVDAVLDLNGKTVEGNVVNHGTLTIKDSSEEGTGLITSDNEKPTLQNDGGKVEILGGTLEGNVDNVLVANEEDITIPEDKSLVRDVTGNRERISLGVDTQKPEITLTNKTPLWRNEDALIEVKVSDVGTGVKEVTFDGKSVSISRGTAEVKVSGNGTYTAIATDYAGNSTTEEITITNIDKVKPIILSVSYDNSIQGETVTLTAKVEDDESGIYGYVLDKKDGNASWTRAEGEAGEEVTIRAYITSNGEYHFSIKDLAGNITTYDEVIRITGIDNGAPTVNKITVRDEAARGYADSATVILDIDAKDDGEIKYIYISNTSMSTGEISALDDSRWLPYSESVLWQLPVGDGEKTAYVWLKDAAGNISEKVPVTTKVYAKYIGGDGVNETSFKVLVKDANYSLSSSLSESNIKIRVKDTGGNVTYEGNAGEGITLVGTPVIYGPVKEGNTSVTGRYYTILVQNVGSDAGKDPSGTIFLVFDKEAAEDKAGNKLAEGTSTEAALATDVVIELHKPIINVTDTTVSITDTDGHGMNMILVNGKSIPLSNGSITREEIKTLYGIEVTSGTVIETIDKCGNKVSKTV